MVRTRTCPLCGASIKQSVAAHECPHGTACTYLCGADDMPVDWSTPKCGECRQRRPALRALPDMKLTDKAWTELGK